MLGCEGVLGGAVEDKQSGRRITCDGDNVGVPGSTCLPHRTPFLRLKPLVCGESADHSTYVLRSINVANDSTPPLAGISAT